MSIAEKVIWIEETIALHEGRLVRYVTQIVGDVERAREIVQETFLRLWNARETDVQNYTAQWLFTVARNMAFDLRKKEKKMKPMPQHDQLVDVSGGERSAPAILEQQEEAGTVMGMLATLPDNQREVIYLKFHSDMSYREISKITGLSASNVGYLIHTGIKTLRTKMAEGGHK